MRADVGIPINKRTPDEYGDYVARHGLSTRPISRYYRIWGWAIGEKPTYSKSWTHAVGLGGRIDGRREDPYLSRSARVRRRKPRVRRQEPTQ
jgi:hypothetical protein